MTALQKAQAAKRKLDELRAHADGELVLAWRTFVKAEASAHALVAAGELDREEWAAMWAEAPELPSEAQYNNARRLGYIEPSYA